MNILFDVNCCSFELVHFDNFLDSFRFMAIGDTPETRAVRKAIEKTESLQNKRSQALIGHSEGEAKALVPRTLADKTRGERIIVVLEKACLELVQLKNNKVELLNCDDHTNMLVKAGKNVAEYRPDITHQTLMALLDSPLNKSGRLLMLVCINNHLTPVFQLCTHIFKRAY